MSDYIHYIDSESISKADKAFKEGKYNVSTLFYGSALYRLKKYPGDRMHPIQLAATLKGKLDKAYKMLAKHPNQKRLYSSKWMLSKSAYVKGKQCPKYLYLDKHKRQERTAPSTEQIELFKKGKEFESLFRNTNFPEAINIANELNNKIYYYASYTDFLLRENNECTLFEAGILNNEVLTLLDVLKKNKDGSIDAYEVKLYTELNEVILWDMSIQYYICKEKFKERLKTFNVVLRDGTHSWKIFDLMDQLEKMQSEVRDTLQHFKLTLNANSAPNIQIGKQCHHPYTCEFVNYCINK